MWEVYKTLVRNFAVNPSPVKRKLVDVDICRCYTVVIRLISLWRLVYDSQNTATNSSTYNIYFLLEKYTHASTLEQHDTNLNCTV